MAIPSFQQFQTALRGTPMAREAKGIYNAALRGGINPAFVAGLASAESTFGTKGYAVGSKNPFGLGVHLGWRFKSYAEATTKLAKTLSGLNYPQLYKRGGLAGLISQYTPASDGNDEAAHARNIIAAGRRTGGNAAQVYVTGGAGGRLVNGPTPVPAVGSGGSQPPMPRTANMGGMGGGAADPRLGALLSRQYNATARGEYNPELMKEVGLAIAANTGQRLRNPSMGMGEPSAAPAPGGAGDAVGGGGPSLPGLPRAGVQPRLSKWGGPDDHRSRAQGDWQSDLAYDLGGPTGRLVTNPMDGRVVKVSGQPGGRPQFAGYGVTVDYGGGRQAFFKHLGQLGPGIRPGARIGRGASIGGLDGKTAGGPHLHLGASSRGFLDQILTYFTGR
jgi:hypothetical protein